MINDSQDPTDELDDIFKLDVFNDNKRISIRYIRDDIAAYIRLPHFFGHGKAMPAKLYDISSRGALIALEKKLKVHSRPILLLHFKDGRQFNIKAKVIHKISEPEWLYGLKFESFNHALGDYLLETQDDLQFK